jgi:hypothetical protein
MWKLGLRLRYSQKRNSRNTYMTSSLRCTEKGHCRYRNIFPTNHRVFLHSPMPEHLRVPGVKSLTFLLAWIVFRSLERNLLQSPMPKKSSDPWSETFYIAALPGKVFLSQEGDLLHCPLAGKCSCPTLQIFLDLCIPEKELAKTRSQI